MRRYIAPVNMVLVGLLLAVLAFLPFGAAAQSPASAASGITMTASTQVSFPLSMTFKVKAQSDANIVKLRVHYVVDRQNFARVTSEGWAQFNPATSVDTQWVLDMRRARLPPATKLEYWWTADDAAGKHSETSRTAVSFDDNRYQWQSITTDPITLFWYKGDRAFANTLMTAAQQGLQKIRQDTGAIPQRKARIYIYASAQELQGSHLFPQQWEGGVAYGEYDLIAIGVALNQLDYGIRAVPHELTHWVVGQLTFNGYGAGLPIWLEEGLATYGEGPALADYQAALTFAIKNNLLISVRTLSSPFSAVPQEAYISYAESNSLVTFLIQKYGKDKMVQLLNTFRQGSSYDAALKQVYGFDQDGLDALWRQSLGIKTTVFAPQSEIVPAVASSPCG